MSRLPRVNVPPVDYGAAEGAMRAYRADGTARALALGNRGPLRFMPDGQVDPAILDAYWAHGFYIFEGLLKADELRDIEDDVLDLLARAPEAKGASTDREGRPALGAGCRAANLSWVRPLSDPLGGTAFANGRHPVKMVEPAAPEIGRAHV